MTEGHEGTADPRLEAQGELSMARLALDEGDLRHAADHVARALVFEPALPEAHELLARLAVHPDGGPDLFPLDKSVFLGTVVARAHVLAALGRHEEALPLLVSAQCHKPDGAWADAAWMYDAGTTGRLPAELVHTSLLRLVSALSDPVPDGERAAVAPYLALVRSVLAADPGHAALMWSASMLLRRTGDTGEAIDLALRSEELEPSFHAATAAGYAYRAEQRWREAEDAWIRALGFDPTNAALHTDIGELLASAGRPRDGLSWVERGLSFEPDDPSAFPTARGLRFRLDGSLHHLVELADHLRDHPDNAHGDNVLAQSSQSRYWLGPIPPSTEAVTNVLHRFLEDGKYADAAPEDLPHASLTVSAPEPPSAILAFCRALPGSSVQVAEVQEPDARRTVPEVFDRGPVRGVDRRVWAYEGTTARPCVPPPAAESAEAVRRAAAYPWRHLPGAYDDAVHLSGVPLDDLLGVLVHPPEPPTGTPGVWPAWVRRVQAWACLGIAHHRSDQPWRESERRGVLTDLAYGPEDWVSEAALLALVATAWTHPDAREDVSALVCWRFLAAMEASRSRPVTVLGSLARLVLATPQAPAELIGLAEEVLSPDDEDGEERE
ncbi:tetratricopeptide repeat protein [Nocardiopsis composta]|uniref:Tetratricopeptide (TPR) repeat protein n=1 Tax=Nocardiopsis composta TaxID=157465 RepID=A0A7W8QQF1_9ACTN|nr:hypothetical protein [Nocardiopsis composta]MBB5434675.1 tetratricopeptide (TPR) repeat protein [Nocardiopsis composta]